MGKVELEGIDPKENSIQIRFRWNGRTFRPRLKIEPTPKNLQYAARVRADILRRIADGSFDMADFFPDYNRGPVRDRSLLGDVVDKFLTSKAAVLAPTTLGEYRNALKRNLGHLFQRAATEIRFTDIDQALARIKGKTRNNVLIAVRGLFAYAVKAGHIKTNPAAGIEWSREDDPDPDPLTPDEAAKVIADMRSHYPEQVGNYFELAFLTGFRPSEGIALSWNGADWNHGTLRIGAARVRGIDKTSKTRTVRDVELDARCIEILKAQKSATFLAKHGRIFTNPNTGNPYRDTSTLVEKFWRRSLQRLGIRDRDARQTRHTFATSCLMAGCNPAWVARQMGHANPAMFFKVYSKWIDRADSGRERGKLSAMLNPQPLKKGMTPNAEITGG